jgi:hypothetical protein
MVYVGRGGSQGDDWTDTEGWEVASALASVDEAIALMTDEPFAVPFLELVRPRLPS